MPERPIILNASNFHARLEEIKAQQGPPPWGVRLVVSEHVTGMLICQAPGTVNDRHYHIEDEWWIIVEGEIDWEIEGRDKPVRARAGDFVFVPKNHFHLIKPRGDQPTIRLAISKTGEPHRHERS